MDGLSFTRGFRLVEYVVVEIAYLLEEILQMSLIALY